MKTSFNKTDEWMKRNARPLEAARWEYLFQEGEEDRVLDILAAFQNEDGGFGHGIEPDFWLPASSPMATWAAGQVLNEIGADSQEKIVQSMKEYLLETYEPESGMWPSVLPETNHYPHAPWWHWKEGVQDNWMFNPGAELAGYLIKWSIEGSEAEKTGWSSVGKAAARLMETETMDSHEICNYQQLLKLLKPDAFTQYTSYSYSELQDKINELAENCIEKDTAKWGSGYQTLPLDIIDHPGHPLAGKYKHLIEQNLNYYEGQLNADGIWEISWNWGDASDAFMVSQQYWKGVLAVDRYQLFQAFGYY
ncbi:hypothetical protein [Halobacillus sp. H74]|uniref:hypothetical protein n=1 Tax=Halobacillus sp. H74 TaxID=3457436 RepID=UPI003FCCDE18